MKNIFKWVLLSISILAIGTWLYAQTAVIGIPWEIKGVNVHLGTSAATGKILLPVTSGGQELYNTADQILNYERGSIRWDANIFKIRTQAGGGGTVRQLYLQGEPVSIIPSDASYYFNFASGAAVMNNRYFQFLGAGTLEFGIYETAFGGMVLIEPTYQLWMSNVAGANFERAFFKWDSNIFKIGTEKGAAGIERDIYMSLPIVNKEFRIESVATNDDPNYRAFQNRTATTDATVTTLHSITLTDENVYLIEARVVARCTGGAGGNVGSGASYILKQAFKRTGAGVATAIGVLTTESWEDAAIALWTATLDTNVNDVRVRVTGGATDNATWHVTVMIQNLST